MIRESPRTLSRMDTGSNLSIKASFRWVSGAVEVREIEICVTGENRSLRAKLSRRACLRSVVT